MNIIRDYLAFPMSPPLVTIGVVIALVALYGQLSSGKLPVIWYAGFSLMCGFALSIGFYAGHILGAAK